MAKKEKIPLDEWKAQQEEKTAQIIKELEDGVRDVFSGGKYAEYLDSMAKFHNYTIGNIIRILRQMPDATYVAGFNDWKTKHERSVKKYEKSIKIQAPSYKKEAVLDANQNPVLDKNGKPKYEKRLQYFRQPSVFDVSQTDGKPLPSLVEELQGSVDGYERLLESLKKTSPVPIEFEQIPGDVKGYYSNEHKRIAINEGMSQSLTFASVPASACA